MNWKTEAVEKLRRYDAMRRAVQNLPLELKRLEAEYTALGGGWSGQGERNRNVRSREDRMMDNIMTRQQLKWSLEQATNWTQQVSGALSGLTPEERLILQQMYILPQTGALNRLTEALNLERTSIYRRRDRALRKFTLNLYGWEESN